MYDSKTLWWWNKQKCLDSYDETDLKKQNTYFLDFMILNASFPQFSFKNFQSGELEELVGLEQNKQKQIAEWSC